MTDMSEDAASQSLRKKLGNLCGGLLVVAVICAVLGLFLGGDWWFFYIIAAVSFVLSLISLFLSRKYA